tara:strand:- start:1091 stop:1471 length:381 start_codon:yes stop_codon:yes gene_type:complete
LKYSVKISKGKIIYKTNKKLLEYIQTISDDTIAEIEITLLEDSRSNKQNKLWWTWAQIIGDTLGYSKNEIHDILKAKFLTREYIQDGKTKKYIKSTATLSKSEFNKLTNDVFFWANDTLNINLPHE